MRTFGCRVGIGNIADIKNSLGYNVSDRGKSGLWIMGNSGDHKTRTLEITEITIISALGYRVEIANIADIDNG